MKYRTAGCADETALSINGTTPEIKDLPHMITELYPGAKVQPRSGARSLLAEAILAAALKKAGLRITDPDRTAILSVGKYGSHSEDLAYWQDYLLHGRQDGRGRLFIGTLATTSACEAAIAFGIRGKVWHMDPMVPSAVEDEIEDLFESGTSMILLLEPDPPEMKGSILIPEKES